MDVQLQELIDKIKKDGVAAADEKASQIISEAEKKADGIVAAAKEEAERKEVNAIYKNARSRKLLCAD